MRGMNESCSDIPPEVLKEGCNANTSRQSGRGAVSPQKVRTANGLSVRVSHRPRTGPPDDE